jgi:hypothetical protein
MFFTGSRVPLAGIMLLPKDVNLRMFSEFVPVHFAFIGEAIRTSVAGRTGNGGNREVSRSRPF